MEVKTTMTIQDLEAAMRAEPNPCVQDRIKCVHSAAQGHTCASIAAELELAESTVWRWINRFNQDGLSGLQNRPTGRPVVTDRFSRSVLRRVREALLDIELTGQQATLSEARRVIEQVSGMQVRDTRSLHKVLEFCGFGWGLVDLEQSKRLSQSRTRLR